MKKGRIAAFGFRSLPPKNGSAGADKFAAELYPRLVKKGFMVTAYNRVYGREAFETLSEFEGVKIINIKTITISGFDSFLHSFKCTLNILLKNNADLVHIHNGGNSIFAVLLRLFGKKVFISQDGVDWKREKWKWYARIYLYLSSFITANIPNKVIFDNIFSKKIFEQKFNKKFDFIPYGCEVTIDEDDDMILQSLGVKKDDYFLFIGRFIPDKGVHYLIKAFEQTETDKSLILVGGSPNPSQYEKSLRKTQDKRVIFPGYIYGNATNVLIKNAYTYIQPSDVEGLSPLVLTVMGIGTPLICSDIEENLFIVKNNSLTFTKGNIEDLRSKLMFALNNHVKIIELAQRGKSDILKRFSWESVTNKHIELFNNMR